MSIRILQGDCREVMGTLDAESIDAIVCDPPYELGFMGKGWDRTGVANDVETWRAALRVLKPGGHLLAFSGTRTYHRMVCAIEDAGFEIRDQIGWLYGSGFPKSLDVSKAIDKTRDDSAEGSAVGAWLKAQREARGFKQKDVAALWPSVTGGLTGCVANWETLGKVPKWEQWLALKAFIGFSDEMDAEVWRLNGRKGTPGEAWQSAEVTGVKEGAMAGWSMDGSTKFVDREVKDANSDAARQWQGWGTALKPAWEPIVMARKPLIGTVAANVLAHGTGALNVDACRVETSDDLNGGAYSEDRKPSESDWVKHGGTIHSSTGRAFVQPQGRWPANVLHDGSDEVLAAFPVAPGAFAPVRGTEPSGKTVDVFGAFAGRAPSDKRDGGGSAARFFYTAKASAHDRNDGLHGLPQRVVSVWGGDEDDLSAGKKSTRPRGNHHPTVKPTDLMRYLCRLVTPPGGTVLDPFMGSGSTLKAAELEGFSAIGIELDAAYIEIARRRIASDAPLFAEVA